MERFQEKVENTEAPCMQNDQKRCKQTETQNLEKHIAQLTIILTFVSECAHKMPNFISFE